MTEAPIFINRNGLRNLGLTWSNSQLLRLESANKFPKRIYLSPHCIAWERASVLKWIAARCNERSA